MYTYSKPYRCFTNDLSTVHCVAPLEHCKHMLTNNSIKIF